MAARGTEAKEQVMKKILECFGQNEAFVFDKKIYINTKENGEKVQVALTLTCPKVLISPDGVNAAPAKSAFSGGLDFESMGAATATPEAFKPAEITPDEKETVVDLMSRLGL